MAKAAKVLGRTEDARQYTDLFNQIRQRFNEEFVSPEGVIKSDTQTVYVLALKIGLLDDAKRAIAV